MTWRLEPCTDPPCGPRARLDPDARGAGPDRAGQPAGLVGHLAREDLTLGDPTAYLKKQFVNVAIGLVLLAIVMATDHRVVRIVAPLVYLASIIGLLLVLIMGSTINGSRSWLQLGGMSIQPSEFAKLAVVIGMVLLVAERAEGRWRSRIGSAEVLGMLVIAGVPAVLIGPARPRHDAGAVGDGLRRARGVRGAAAGCCCWPAAVSPAAALAVAAGLLKEYQVLRVPRLHQPRPRPARRRLQREQARIAVGNGGLFGQGAVRRFPDALGLRARAAHRDFIFTVAGDRARPRRRRGS